MPSSTGHVSKICTAYHSNKKFICVAYTTNTTIDIFLMNTSKNKDGTFTESLEIVQTITLPEYATTSPIRHLILAPLTSSDVVGIEDMGKTSDNLMEPPQGNVGSLGSDDNEVSRMMKKLAQKKELKENKPQGASLVTNTLGLVCGTADGYLSVYHLFYRQDEKDKASHHDSRLYRHWHMRQGLESIIILDPSDPASGTPRNHLNHTNIMINCSVDSYILQFHLSSVADELSTYSQPADYVCRGPFDSLLMSLHGSKNRKNKKTNRQQRILNEMRRKQYGMTSKTDVDAKKGSSEGGDSNGSGGREAFRPFEGLPVAAQHYNWSWTTVVKSCTLVEPTRNGHSLAGSATRQLIQLPLPVVEAYRNKQREGRKEGMVRDSFENALHSAGDGSGDDGGDTMNDQGSSNHPTSHSEDDGDKTARHVKQEFHRRKLLHPTLYQSLHLAWLDVDIVQDIIHPSSIPTLSINSDLPNPDDYSDTETEPSLKDGHTGTPQGTASHHKGASDGEDRKVRYTYYYRTALVFGRGGSQIKYHPVRKVLVPGSIQQIIVNNNNINSTDNGNGDRAIIHWSGQHQDGVCIVDTYTLQVLWRQQYTRTIELGATLGSTSPDPWGLANLDIKNTKREGVSNPSGNSTLLSARERENMDLAPSHNGSGAPGLAAVFKRVLVGVAEGLPPCAWNHKVCVQRARF
jgi:hypothetical protein